MTTSPAHFPEAEAGAEAEAPLRVVAADGERPDRWARIVNRVTREAFALSGALPGLPGADGAVEPEERVAAELRAGTAMWVAFRGDRAAGAVRAAPVEGAWKLRRLAVPPRERGRGTGRALTRRLEEDARRAGMPRVVLDAVVERTNPPFYAALGYRTLSHWPTGDKPLSEVTMEREVASPPLAFDYPWEGEEGAPAGGLLISWYARGPSAEAGPGLCAVAGRVEGDARATVEDHGRAAARALQGTGPPRFLGADGWPGCDRAQAGRALERVAAHAAAVHPLGDRGGFPSRLLAFDTAPEATAPFVLPRGVEPSLLALWRLPWPGA
jgi:predicted N-acetyltransferase YhbS